MSNLTDLDAMMKAATEAANNMREPVTTADGTASTSVETNVSNTPMPITMPTAEQLQKTMANLNIGGVLDKMVSDPEQTKKLMAESMGHMSPEMVEQAKKMAQGGQADRILKEMQKRGMNPHQMKAEMEQQRKTMKELMPKNVVPMKKALIITLNRQLKSRAVPIDCGQFTASSILHCKEPIEISCSRLALGPWADKPIKVWYDGTLKGKNKRASKIVGFPVAGDIIIHAADDLLETDFNDIEKELE